MLLYLTSGRKSSVEYATEKEFLSYDNTISGEYVTDTGIGESSAADPAGKIATIIYGYVVMGVNSYAIDLVFTGQMQSVQFFIFSHKFEEVANQITQNLKRGVTVVDCQGWYTGEHHKMLTVFARKSEMPNIVRTVKSVDPDAFLSISNVMGVYGKGFDTLKS